MRELNSQSTAYDQRTDQVHYINYRFISF